MKLTEQQLAKIGFVEFRHRALLRGKAITAISTDTRTLIGGSLFVALKGPNFDGHGFLDRALAGGALVLMVNEGTRDIPSVPMLVVKDTLLALGELAAVYRAEFAIPVIAIGGSNGKTTTKEMTAAVLRTKYTILQTEGNLNNQVGVPQTLFRLDPKHEAAVIELGTNHPGELAALCTVAQPTHALLTNIGNEHLEFFENLVGVAAEEGVLFAALEGKKGTVAVVNGDDRLVTGLAKRVRRKVLYGFRARHTQVKGARLHINERGCASFTITAGSHKPVKVQLGIPGLHNAENALAAAAVGVAFRIPLQKIKNALEQFEPVRKRMEMVVAGGVTILNDTYNANPDSMRAALATLHAVSGRKIAVLADMLELGARSAEEHRRVGEEVTRAGVDALLTFGPEAKGIHDAAKAQIKLHYDQKNVLVEYLAELLQPGDVVLVKGSRGMKMEDVVAFLEQRRNKS